MKHHGQDDVLESGRLPSPWPPAKAVLEFVPLLPPPPLLSLLPLPLVVNVIARAAGAAAAAIATAAAAAATVPPTQWLAKQQSLASHSALVIPPNAPGHVCRDSG